jgi:hypothetical protein
MSSERLERFLDLVQVSIAELADKYSEVPEEFIKSIIRQTEFIKGETRRYIEEVPEDKSRTERFVLDMIGKVEYVEKLYYKKKDILYQKVGTFRKCSPFTYIITFRK